MAESDPLLPFAIAVTGGVGGVVGALITQFWQGRRTRHHRPRLSLAFDPTSEGCEVETPTTAEKVKQRYLRLRVENTGRSAAENVTISIVRISFQPEDRTAPRRAFREEVLDLPVALTAEYPVRIPAGGHRFMDVVFTIDEDGKVGFGFAFRNNPIRLQTFGFGPGTYWGHLFASADGADSERAEIQWTWDGTFSGLRAIRLGHIAI